MLKPLRTLRHDEGGPVSIAWSPDGTRLALGDSKGGVTVLAPEGRREPVDEIRHEDDPQTPFVLD